GLDFNLFGLLPLKEGTLPSTLTHLTLFSHDVQPFIEGTLPRGLLELKFCKFFFHTIYNQLVTRQNKHENILMLEERILDKTLQMDYKRLLEKELQPNLNLVIFN